MPFSQHDQLTPAIEGVIWFPLRKHEDRRGWLTELWRGDTLSKYTGSYYKRPVMGYISYTKPGITRGPHEHNKQSDLFAFIGPGDFQLYLWDNRGASPSKNPQQWTVGENNPTAVLIPPGVVHAYKNISKVEGMVLNFPDELYKGWDKNKSVDEIRWEDNPHSPFVVEDDRQKAWWWTCSRCGCNCTIQPNVEMKDVTCSWCNKPLLSLEYYE